MKVIDKNGKLFGTINLIDLLFILILVIAIIGGSKRLGGTKIVNEPDKEGYVKFMVQNVRQITVDSIKKEDKVYHYDKGNYLGVIDDISVEPYTKETEYQGKFYQAEVPERYTMLITIKSNIGENEQTYTAGGEQMKLGNEYRMKTKTAAFFGTCIGVDVNK